MAAWDASVVVDVEITRLLDTKRRFLKDLIGVARDTTVVGNTDFSAHAHAE